MAERKASHVFVECLKAEGVTHVFGIPGEETLDLNEALADSSITFVPVRHEQAGAYMADVYGRLTGRAGVCLGTLGPGATNLVTRTSLHALMIMVFRHAHYERTAESFFFSLLNAASKATVDGVKSVRRTKARAS